MELEEPKLLKIQKIQKVNYHFFNIRILDKSLQKFFKYFVNNISLYIEFGVKSNDLDFWHEITSQSKVKGTLYCL